VAIRTNYDAAVWRRLVAGGALVLAASGGIASATESATVAGTIAYDVGNRLELSDLDGANRHLLVRTPGRQPGAPVWSPDGSAIAFARGGDVYIAGLADRTVTRVAHLPGFAYFLRWSPDGSQIAFSREARNWCQSGWPSTRGIYIADARRNGVRKLRSIDPGPSRHVLSFTARGWSPDGKRLLYGEDQWQVPGDCRYMGTNWVRSSLLHVAVAGGRPTRIPAGESGQGQWSPDGRRIAFCGDGVIVARPDGRLVRRWPNQGSEANGCVPWAEPWLVWSHRGDEVYAATDDRVVALRVSDGHQRTLLTELGVDCSANCFLFIDALSSDGSLLVVEAQGAGEHDTALIALRTDGKQSTRLPYPRGSFAVYLP
jgi:Tol biopolymer transport system component